MYSISQEEKSNLIVKTMVHQLMEDKHGNRDEWPDLSALEMATGLNRNTINRWIKDRVERIPLDTLAVWCAYFDCEPGDLFFLERDS